MVRTTNDDLEIIDEELGIVRNENGVECEVRGYNTLIPSCCWSCDHLDSEDMGEYVPSAYYCTINLMFPTKKGTCKRYKPDYWTRKQTEGAHEDSPEEE